MSDTSKTAKIIVRSRGTLFSSVYTVHWYVYDTCEKVVVDLFSLQNKLAVCIFCCLIVTVLYLVVNVDRLRRTNSLCIATLEYVYQYACIWRKANLMNS